jgi:hypothetical protein
MASFYAKERSKTGSISGTIICWPIELDNLNPVSEENKRKLPSGYLKCDGSKYNASVYPQLAEIIGTGNNCIFLRRNLNGDPLTSLTDEEFVVPDLGSKYIRPVPGSDAGTYNGISVLNKSGVEKRRSGMGIDATSTVGSTIAVTYTGKFSIPSQEISLKGKPSWIKGTNNLGYTDSESVDNTAIHPHMHFSNTNRCRIKSSNTPVTGLDAIAGSCAYRTASTISIDDWLNNTKINSSTPAGSNQPPCWAIASAFAAAALGGPVVDDSILGGFFGGTGEFIYYNICYTGGTLNDLRYNCLLTNPVTYNLGQQVYAIGSSGQPASFIDDQRLFLVSCRLENGTPKPLDNSSTRQSAPATYIAGAAGVPTDWKNISLADVVPINSNNASTTAQAYPQITNVFTEVDELVQADGDPTIHNHKIQLNVGTHTYKVKTSSFLLEPDALSTQLTLTPDTAHSLDAVSSPYIIMEYLIKI